MPSPLPNPCRGLVLALLPLAACKEPVIEVIEGVSADLEITLVNPTECGACDPFRGVDTLKLEVTVGADEVASDSFAYPTESVVLPDISGFGVVRVQLLGLQEGRVISAGRTPEIVLMPGESQSVPMLFLPANAVLPLAAPMLSARSRHTALVRRDGTVLLVGGQDARGERVLATTELYDPATGAFTDTGPVTSSGAANLLTGSLPDGATLLAGGYAILEGASVATEGVTIWNETEGVFEESPSLTAGRDGGCLAMFEERKGLVLGGGPEMAEYLKPDAKTGEWVFSSLEMFDFDPASVTGCVELGDGTVFVQGHDAASTGRWDGADGEPSQAFTAVNAGAAGDVRYVEGAALRSTEAGVAWVLGGADTSTGELYADGRVFSADAMRLEAIDAFGEPQFEPQLLPWIEDGWFVAGCGWADAGRAEGASTLELVAPGLGSGSPVFDLDRSRPGCALSVLRDGAVLVTGGNDPEGPAGDDAGLFVPYLDPTRSG